MTENALSTKTTHPSAGTARPTQERDQGTKETLHFEARDTLRVTPEALWPLVADTPKLNRALGLPPVEYSVAPAEGGGSRVQAHVRVLGMPLMRWTEHPFRWEAPHAYTFLREFQGGLVERVLGGVRLTPSDGGTEVLVHADIRPRNALGALLARRVIGPRSVQQILKQCRVFERYLLGQAADPFPQLVGKHDSAAQADGAAALLPDSSNQVGVERLRRHLAEAPDEDVVKMRPFELADRWGLDRRETLALFLHATTAGLLVMTWDVLCPNCRVGQAEYRSLRDLEPQAHCDVCNITFDARFDRLVEVRFSVAPALRRVQSRTFCIGGPMNTPHVLAQIAVPAGGRERLTSTLAPGTYRFRSAPSSGQLLLDAAAVDDGRPTPEEATTVRVTVGPATVEPAVARVHAGAVTLEVANRTDRDQRVVLEEGLWPDTVATAAMVSTMQEFRDLFSSEALAPGLQLGIENLAFMFTDLTGSTALYQAVGQARAFRLVQDHFGVLGNAIRGNGGALIKTIGDAVMAAFPSGAEALAAALQIQRDIRGLAVPAEVDAGRLVKIGLHQGPCVAVNLNSRLDYFGTTVNTAARIEHECRGGEIVASLAVCRSEAATRLLEESGARLQEEVVPLRGLEEPVPIYRISPS